MNLGSKREKAAWLLVGVVALATTACGDLLQVEDPSRFTTDALKDPRALTALANGIEGQMQLQMDGYVTGAALLSDEFMHTGTWSQWDDADKGRLIPAGGDEWNQDNLLNVRFEAQQARTTIEEVLGDTASKSVLIPQVVTSEAWTDLLMGIENCESPESPNGPAVSDTAMYEVAIAKFTEAMQLAQGAGSTHYAEIAQAGRARANLLAGHLDAALADAQAIPDGFLYEAEFSETSGTQNNSVVQLAYASNNKAGGLEQMHWAEVDTVAGFFRDPWSGQLDHRVPILRAGTGVNGITPFYSEAKYTSLGDNIPITHWQEMRLIEAEVYWRRGEFGTAIDRINSVRAAANLPAVANPGTSDGVFDILLSERFAQLFLEGQRANDLYRFNLVASMLGTGRSTKFPLDNDEILNNPNIPDEGTDRCPTIS